MTSRTIRSPVSAGTGRFYPASRAALCDTLNRLVPDPGIELDGRLVALVAPHAGYMFSGHTAGRAFSTLRDSGIRRAIVVGPSHYCRFAGASVFDGLAYGTPLGEVPVDADFVSLLLRDGPEFHFHELAEEQEHSVEVEVPFLQHVLGDFELVAILMADQGYDNASRIARAVRAAMTALPKPTVFVASSDLYHGPNHQYARAQSQAAADAVSELDPEGFADGIVRREYQACGAGPITTGMLVALGEGATEARLLHLTTSYEVYPMRDDYVVGYMGVAFVA